MLFVPCVLQSLYLGKEPFQHQFTDFLLGTQSHAHPCIEQGDPRALRLPRSPPSPDTHAPSHPFHPPATALVKPGICTTKKHPSLNIPKAL